MILSKGIYDRPMFKFGLGIEDTDRLFSVKATQGKNNLNDNEFARELLEKELHRFAMRRSYDKITKKDCLRCVYSKKS